MQTKIDIAEKYAQQHHISNLHNSQFTKVICHHVVLSLIMDWWDAMVGTVALHCRDEQTVKFFSPSPVLIW